MTTPPAGKYAVIGASGLVGSHVLRLLADQPGIQVTAISRKSPTRVTGANIETVFADAAHSAELVAPLQGVDYVLICAGILATAPVLAADPVGTVLANLCIATGALEAAYGAGCKKCIWLSSTTGYPPSEQPLNEGQFFDGDPPENWYGIGSMTRYVEHQCRWYAEKIAKPMPMMVLRPSLIYGEFDHFDEQTAHFLPSFIRRVVNREDPIEIWGTGEQARDLVYAGDVARAMIAGVNSKRSFATYNVAAGKTHTVNECMSLLLTLDGYENAEVVHLTDKPTSRAKVQFNIDQIKADLGFVPVTPLAEGLRRTIEWYRLTILENRTH